ncbi:MAG: hypothetical protein QXO70_00835, partial [Candidatus Pacearchaeota archaeon]
MKQETKKRIKEFLYDLFFGDLKWMTYKEIFLFLFSFVIVILGFVEKNILFLMLAFFILMFSWIHTRFNKIETLIKNKKGQVILSSALVIIIIFAGIYASIGWIKVEPVNYKIYDLGKELDFETAEVFDHAMYTGKPIDPLMEIWLGNFSNYIQNKDVGMLIFLWINESGQIKVKAYSYRERAEIYIGSSMGMDISYWDEEPQSNIRVFAPSELTGEEKIKVTLGNFTATFTYDPYQKYYFVIVGRSGREVYWK